MEEIDTLLLLLETNNRLIDGYQEYLTKAGFWNRMESDRVEQSLKTLFEEKQKLLKKIETLYKIQINLNLE